MSRALPALFRRFPQAREHLPWIPLGDLPTPLESLGNLRGRAAPASVWVKRDDRSSRLYGGNKVRALEFLLADALCRRVDRVLTAGAIGSHFVSATALFSRRVGLRAEAILWSQPWSERCTEALDLLHRLDVPVRSYAHPAIAVAALILSGVQHRLSGRRVALFPPGGSSPRGALGFVDAALEVAEQVAAGEMPPPESIWVACGSGGSAAGLALGLSLAQLTTRVRAVRVTPRLACNRHRLLGLAAGAWRLLCQGMEAETEGAAPGATHAGEAPAGGPRFGDRLELVEGFYPPGYARETPASRDAAELLTHIGLPGDTTYTGRAMAALLQRAPLEGGTHLYWHTLGSEGAQG